MRTHSGNKDAKLIKAKRESDSDVRKTMRISVTEGIFSQVYGSLSTIGSGFITKFMLILGASPLQFSLLSALGQVSAVFQPLGVALTHRLKRRKGACIAITAVGRFFTFFLGLALLFPSGSQGIWFLLSLLFISAGLQATGANIWIAWMSDMIPLSIRGRFFSRRNQIMLVAGLVVSYIVSFHVDLFEKTQGWGRDYLSFIHLDEWFRVENQAFFLGMIFIFATLLSLFGLTILARQPEREARKLELRPLVQIYLEPFKDKNFRLLMVFGVWWMLAIGVGSAFWGPFMLKKLEMGLFRMQLYGTLHMAASLIAYNFWGRFIDRYGNKTAMKICVILGGLNPMFWLFLSKENYNLLWFEAVISGFMWAGTAIITTNFVLSIAGKGKEQVYSGLYGAIAGISMMTSTLLSGVFYPSSLNIGIRILEPEQVVFGIGGILRWLTIIPLMAVQEKRAVPLYRALSQVFRYMSEMVAYRFKRG
ncbi:MAG: MFS transporter [Candidatus Cloacimonadaceae bacterium]|nr:MFS transporter [Candidatus Cloacimonadaceae bacterium]MDP3114036.1 MFS transporter [Candidatus Cloacimonadaceae bacterium]